MGNRRNASVSSFSGAVTGALESLARRYPAPLIEAQLKDIPRIAFHIELVEDWFRRKILWLPTLAAASAYSRWMRRGGDDGHPGGRLQRSGEPFRPGYRRGFLHRELGVIVDSRDVMNGFQLPSKHFDVIASFDSMEHWHQSPKTLFHGLIDSLRPGGWFVLSGPNCVNLRKRITVPLGFGEWSSMSSWYEEEVFRAHVRGTGCRRLAVYSGGYRTQEREDIWPQLAWIRSTGDAAAHAGDRRSSSP